jgi:hypothetical protein
VSLCFPHVHRNSYEEEAFANENKCSKPTEDVTVLDLQYDVDYFGGDIGGGLELILPSWEACNVACARRAGCVRWVYWSRGIRSGTSYSPGSHKGACWLKGPNHAGAETGVRGYISGRPAGPGLAG